MANDNLSNLPWEDPDYRAELDRSLMAYGAYLSRTELAVASTSRSLGEFDMPQDWYLLKDENRDRKSTRLNSSHSCSSRMPSSAFKKNTNQVNQVRTLDQ